MSILLISRRGMLGISLLAGSLAALKPGAQAEPLRAMVSVLPQKYVVDRIGGDQVKVTVMVGPGKSPATYEPSPRQLAFMSKAAVYFTVGVPFEDAWMKRIKAANRDMQVSDMRFGINLSKVSLSGHPAHADCGGAHGMDPHIWTDPLRVKKMAGLTAVILATLDPANQALYRRNLESMEKEMDALDRDIRSILAPAKERRFMVFHPAWGYFAERYNLEQIPIEFEGKEAGARQMARIINRAREAGIKKIFVQSQFRSKDAKAIARAIGADIVNVDPLSEDYVSNLKNVAMSLAEAMQ